jgi:hypothetical protein
MAEVATALPAAAPVDRYKSATRGDIINPVKTAWVLLGAFLVFGMQAARGRLLPKSRNRKWLVECMFDTCVCGLLHWGWGFAFMFGEGNPLIGWHLPGDPTKSLLFMKDVSVLTTYGVRHLATETGSNTRFRLRETSSSSDTALYRQVGSIDTYTDIGRRTIILKAD